MDHAFANRRCRHICCRQRCCRLCRRHCRYRCCRSRRRTRINTYRRCCRGRCRLIAVRFAQEIARLSQHGDEEAARVLVVREESQTSLNAQRAQIGLRKRRRRHAPAHTRSQTHARTTLANTLLFRLWHITKCSVEVLVHCHHRPLMHASTSSQCAAPHRTQDHTHTCTRTQAAIVHKLVAHVDDLHTSVTLADELRHNGLVLDWIERARRVDHHAAHTLRRRELCDRAHSPRTRARTSKPMPRIAMRSCWRCK
jgi:hypothetical protein